MVLTPSKMMPLDTKAPQFKLEDVVKGEDYDLSSIKIDKGLVVMFICNHCPYVKYILKALVKIANTFVEKGVSFVAISSNDAEEYPEDCPEEMKLLSINEGFSFPYLYDETQEVAKAYGAACTPDFFIFNNDLSCVYRGQFCDARPGNDIAVTGKDLLKACQSLIESQPVTIEQKPSVGCNIKWRKGKA